jgi:transcriptional regulator with XRE-family HTH domain
MEHEEEGESRWLVNPETVVARNVRQIREARGISQQQLGKDLAFFGVGMHQTTVAKLEAGSKPLRLNEVAAIAHYFDVPVESLWEWSIKDVDELAEQGLVTMIELLQADLKDARGEADVIVRAVAMQTAVLGGLETDQREVELRQKELTTRLADLEQRRDRISQRDE